MKKKTMMQMMKINNTCNKSMKKKTDYKKKKKTDYKKNKRNRNNNSTISKALLRVDLSFCRKENFQKNKSRIVTIINKTWIKVVKWLRYKLSKI